MLRQLRTTDHQIKFAKPTLNGPASLGFVVDKVGMGQVLLGVFLLLPVSVISLMRLIHLFTHSLIYRVCYVVLLMRSVLK